MGGTARWRNRFSLTLLTCVAMTGVVACGDDAAGLPSIPGSPESPPPPPPPVPLTIALSATSRNTAILAGASAPADSVVVSVTGDGAAAVAWSAAARRSWTRMLTTSGLGSGMIRWSREAAGLAPGIYLDTISVSAVGMTSTARHIVDTLIVSVAPIPLALATTGASRRVTAILGGAPLDDSMAVLVTGTGAAQTGWVATRRQNRTTLTTGSGTGSGLVRWRRSLDGLAVGTWVDTISITSAQIPGTVVRVYDTLEITQPLTLQLTAASRRATMTAGSASLADSVGVVIGGSGAGAATWSTTRRGSWTTLTTGSGTGSGRVRWTRSGTGLAAGRYVDTLTVTVAGATGSPATVIDTLDVTAAPGGGVLPTLGPMGSLNGRRVFPASDPWNQPVDTAQVDPNSAAILAKVGAGKSLHPDFFANFEGRPYGIPWQVVPDDTPRASFIFEYDGESDPGPYPIPLIPVIEGDPDDGDRHMIVITQGEFKLYETFYTYKHGTQWTAGSGAIFDMVNGTQRPQGWTSADAAGLPIFPGLVRGDEVIDRGEILHALRFTVVNSRRAYVAPATHWASSKTDPLLPPMGMRVRLKASVDISGYSPQAQVILRALKKYGMMLADNGGDFFLSGAPDPRWDDAGIDRLKQIKVGDFEVVRMTNIITTN